MPSTMPAILTPLRSSANSAALAVLLGSTVLLLIAAWLGGPSRTWLPNSFIVLHQGLAIGAVIVSILGVQIVRRQHTALPSRAMVVLGSAFLGLALLEFASAVSMSAMATPARTSQAISLSLAGRFLMAAALAYVAWTEQWPRLRVGSARNGLLAGIALVGALAWLISGYGASRLKSFIEWLIIGVNLAATYGFYQQAMLGKDRLTPPHRYDPATFVTAAAVAALGGLSVAFTADVGSVFTLIGHAYAVAAVWFIYRGLSAGMPASADTHIFTARHLRGIAVFEWDRASDRCVWGGDSASLLGIDASVPMSTSAFFAAVHPRDRERLRRLLAQVGRENGAFATEFRLDRPEMAPVWVRAQGVAVQNDAGQAIRLAGACVDITDRKLVEQALQDSVQRAEMALASGDLGLWSYDPKTQHVTFDERARGIWGLAGSSSCQETEFDAVVHADDRSRRHTVQQAALDPHGSGHYDIEYRIAAANGQPERWVAVRGQAKFEHGEATSMIGTVRDISARKSAEAVLARSNERLEAEVLERTRQLEAMYDAAVNAILTIDPRGLIQSINTATTRLLGYSRAELLGQNVRIIMPEPYASRHDGYIEAYLQTGRKKIIGIGREVMARRKDGITFPIYLSISEFEVNGRRYFTGIITDLTDRKAAELTLRETERQLAQAQKMEAVGQLTGGLAHDFNNLLTVITGNLELLDMRVEGAEERDLIRRADEAARMGARLTGRLLTFSRRRALQPTVLNLNEVTLGMTELLRRTLGETVSVAPELAPDLWAIRADASEIENAILNLAINARDAMPNGGHIRITTANVVLNRDDLSQSPGTVPGPFVKLSVSDNGSGMTPEVVARAFEPFFTTKDAGRGTGLGLSTIYGFVRQSGGHAVIHSEVGKGTTVDLFFPRDISGAAPLSTVERPVSTTAPVGETVLVVEDNEQVRQLTVKRLDALGYRILVAEDGASAIIMLERHPDIDLVFSDVVMPGGMSGFDVLRWARQHRPDVKVLLTSGFTPEMAKPDDATGAAVKLLRKPYVQADLARAIREALHG
ncbi:MAG: PAS domain S-box protein [Hyphomicrobiaceae bacterium]